MSLITIVPAPIVTLFPIVIPGIIVALAPINERAPIFTSPAIVAPGAIWQYAPISH
jgi:hypothetical protein